MCSVNKQTSVDLTVVFLRDEGAVCVFVCSYVYAYVFVFWSKGGKKEKMAVACTLLMLFSSNGEEHLFWNPCTGKRRRAFQMKQAMGQFIFFAGPELVEILQSAEVFVSSLASFVSVCELCTFRIHNSITNCFLHISLMKMQGDINWDLQYVHDVVLSPLQYLWMLKLKFRRTLMELHMSCYIFTILLKATFLLFCISSC